MGFLTDIFFYVILKMICIKVELFWDITLLLVFIIKLICTFSDWEYVICVYSFGTHFYPTKLTTQGPTVTAWWYLWKSNQWHGGAGGLLCCLTAPGSLFWFHALVTDCAEFCIFSLQLSVWVFSQFSPTSQKTCLYMAWWRSIAPRFE